MTIPVRMLHPVILALAAAVTLVLPGAARTAAAQQAEETLAAGYVVFPTIRPLLTRSLDYDRFNVRVVRKAGAPTARVFHLAITISRGGHVLVRREASARANTSGGAVFEELNLAPIAATVLRGRFVSIIPWQYDGFTFLAEVRESGPAGPLVYRYHDPNKVMGISPKGLFDAFGWQILIGALLLLAASTAIEAALRRGHGRTIVTTALVTAFILAVMAIGFTRYMTLGIAIAALALPCLPMAARRRLTTIGPLIEALRGASRGRRLALLSPAVLAVCLTLWLLSWHHALIVAYRFSPAHFSEFAKLLLGAYFFVSLGLSFLVHGWLLRPGSVRFARAAIWFLSIVFVASGVTRILDGGAFLYSAAHVDEDFWRLAFNRGNLRLVMDPLAALLFVLLGLLLAGFVALLRLARRWPAVVAPLRPGPAPAGRGMSGGGLLLPSGIVALVCLVAAHSAWLAAWRGPFREISSDVQQNFAGIPEIKFVQPLVRAYFAAKPAVPPRLAPALVEKLERAGVRLYSISDEYPLLKRSIYLDPAGRTADKPRFPPGTNIIIITVESLSRSLLREDVHGVRGLTPNFDDFRAHSVSFSNLFSSEFPTIKGMIATFGSFMFDHRGLTIFSDVDNPLKSRYLFLSDILKERYGYETIHAQSDLATFGNVGNILLKHRYDEFHGAESPDILAQIRNPITKPWGIFDEDLYRFVVSRLKARDPRRPLLMTIAPTDTHFPFTNLAPHPDTGGNALLNSVHGTDRAFGIFWEYFKSSPYRDNTVVWLTGDHAMVTRALRAVDANMRLSEFDYIATMMYAPGNEGWRGRRVDTICTQIDAAPTLLDMMDVDLENPFLGLSIFSERPRYPLAISREIPVDPITGQERAVVGALNWTPADHETFLGFLRGLAASDRIRPHGAALR